MTKDSQNCADGDPIEKMFGKADPPPGKKYDFVYAEVSNPRLGVICINWGARGCGFGEVTMLMRESGGFYIDSECMSDQFLAELLVYVVSKSVKDPETIPADCYASHANRNEADMPRDESICAAYTTVDTLVKHHGMVDGDYLKELERRANEAHDRWFHKQYKKAGT